MTDPASLSVVVLAIGPDRLSRRAVQIGASVDPTIELVVVHGFATNTEASARIGVSLSPHAVRWVPHLGTEGSARNAAIAAASGELIAFVDGSEDLPHGLLGNLADALAANADAGLVVVDGIFTPTPTTAIRIVDVSDVVATAGRFATACVWRRNALARIGGFDEQLPALADWDAVLTLQECGGRAIIAPSAEVVRFGDDVHRRATLRPERYLPSIRRILAKHSALFAGAPALALSDRDRVAKLLWTNERSLIARRDGFRLELAGLMRDLEATRAQLQPFGRDTLEWNDLRRTTPLSRHWGLDRGGAIDRVYIEEFLDAHREDVHGHVLEVLDASLTTAYGCERVDSADVIDIDAGNPRATVIADLRSAPHLQSNRYDCFILTQTLHLIDDMAAVVAEAHRLLKPGGVLLVTMPAASMVAVEYGGDGDHWRVTEAGARQLFARHFAPADLEVRARGNVLATTAFLYGLSREELRPAELRDDDPAYPTLITIRAVKANRAPAVVTQPAPCGAAILLYHRIADVPYDLHQLSVRPDDFEAQLAVIARDWQPMTLAALAAAVAAGAPPERAIALTFDDGYLDNLEVAAPLLRDAGIPATFFLTSESPNRQREFWWDRLERAFLTSPSPTVEQRQEHDALYAQLKKSLPASRESVMRRISNGPPAGSAARPMIASEMRRASELPFIDIGAHSVHHLALPEVGPEVLHREVFDSRFDLERVIGQPVSMFAYPFGQHAPTVIAAVAAADFSTAVTCESRPLRAREHPLRLPRLQVASIGETAFAAWLDDAFSAQTPDGSRTRAK